MLIGIKIIVIIIAVTILLSIIIEIIIIIVEIIKLIVIQEEVCDKTNIRACKHRCNIQINCSA